MVWRSPGTWNVALAAVVAAGFCGRAALRADDAWLEQYRAPTARIIAEAISNKDAWNRLAEFTDSFPARLSGSVSLQRSIEWVADRMKKDGLENVRLEKVMVPHWVRGTERAEIVEPFPQAIMMAALGGSVGTPPDGVQAEAIVVKTCDDLEALGSAGIKGKIVVYDFVYRTDRERPIAAPVRPAPRNYDKMAVL